MSVVLCIDLEKLFVVEWPGQANLRAIRPAGYEARIPVQLFPSIGSNDCYKVWDHAMRIRASIFELLSHFLEVAEAFDSL